MGSLTSTYRLSSAASRPRHGGRTSRDHMTHLLEWNWGRIPFWAKSRHGSLRSVEWPRSIDMSFAGSRPPHAWDRLTSPLHACRRSYLPCIPSATAATLPCCLLYNYSSRLLPRERWSPCSRWLVFQRVEQDTAGRACRDNPRSPLADPLRVSSQSLHKTPSLHLPQPRPRTAVSSPE